MAKATIELDWTVIREAIDAEVAPAVRKVLAEHHDIPAMIAQELLLQPEEQKTTLDTFISAALVRTSGWLAGPLLIERMVRGAIREAAQNYIEYTIEARREELEAAFRRMMKDSPDRLVKAFVGMIEGADLGLEIEATIKAVVADDDD